MISVGYKENSVQFVPLSGLAGINIGKDSLPSELTSWYNPQAEEASKKGLTLLDALLNFKAHPKAVDKPLRLCVYDYYNKPKMGHSEMYGDCLSIKVESGVVMAKDKVTLMPLGKEVLIRAISKNNFEVKMAYSGQLCELAITIPKELDS